MSSPTKQPAPSTTQGSLPPIVSREEWQSARDSLLAREKEETRARDAVNAERRRLPMVAIDKPYAFEGPAGKVKLLDLFEGRRQLIVQHFMFDPTWEQGCPSCSFLTDSIGHLAHLHARDISLVLISRAPFEKLSRYEERMGWTVPWFSSSGSDFNADFGVTTDKGEQPGVSVFLRDGERVFHTYFTSGRGVESLSGLTGYLDLAPYGRQETWEDSPEGWPQGPAITWVRRHDSYG